MTVLVCWAEKRRGKSDSIDCTPPDYIMPGAKDRPLLPLHPGVRDMKVSWSPSVICIGGRAVDCFHHSTSGTVPKTGLI